MGAQPSRRPAASACSTGLRRRRDRRRSASSRRACRPPAPPRRPRRARRGPSGSPRARRRRTPGAVQRPDAGIPCRRPARGRAAARSATSARRGREAPHARQVLVADRAGADDADAHGLALPPQAEAAAYARPTRGPRKAPAYASNSSTASSAAVAAPRTRPRAWRRSRAGVRGLVIADGPSLRCSSRTRSPSRRAGRARPPRPPPPSRCQLEHDPGGSRPAKCSSADRPSSRPAGSQGRSGSDLRSVTAGPAGRARQHLATPSTPTAEVQRSGGLKGWISVPRRRSQPRRRSARRLEPRVRARRGQPRAVERVAQTRRVGEVERLDPREADLGQARQRARQVGGDRVPDRVELDGERGHPPQPSSPWPSAPPRAGARAGSGSSRRACGRRGSGGPRRSWG